MISQVYKNWESSFAILSEIFRNMGMAVVAVFVITLVMLSDLRLCLMVLALASRLSRLRPRYIKHTGRSDRGSKW